MSKTSIRLIKESDLSNLMRWKNNFKNRFFYQKEITEPEQQIWYLKYLDNDKNFMFIVEVDSNIKGIGCMGIRLINNYWDIYNVILGDNLYSKKGHMSKALKQMISFANSFNSLPIKLDVLDDNPAVKWYLSNDFVIIEKKFNYYSMQYLN
jgi:RimJ/RimL family protein N-acetyltransferase